MAAELIMCILM